MLIFVCPTFYGCCHPCSLINNTFLNFNLSFMLFCNIYCLTHCQVYFFIAFMNWLGFCFSLKLLMSIIIKLTFKSFFLIFRFFSDILIWFSGPVTMNFEIAIPSTFRCHVGFWKFVKYFYIYIANCVSISTCKIYSLLSRIFKIFQDLVYFTWLLCLPCFRICGRGYKYIF